MPLIARARGDAVTDGRLNRLLGWLLLTLTFLASAALDGWSLSIRDPDALRTSHALFARHAQAVALGMGFFQLLVGLLLSRLARPCRRAALVRWLAVAGSLLYAAGYGVYVFWPQAGAGAAAVGAILNTAAVFLLTQERFATSLGAAPRVAAFVLCGGTLLDFAMASAAFAEAGPNLRVLLPGWAVDPLSVQMRMLRLARAAMIALPLLSLLYAEALEKARPAPRLLEWAGVALTFGAATMSLNLVLAACVWLPLKNLLGGPADAAVAGVLAGAWLAYRKVSPLGLVGWLLILLSMSAGLVMGLYAFDGPMAEPDFLGSYNDFARRVSRLAHAYVIIYGLILLNLQRDLPAKEPVYARLLIVAGAAWSMLLAVLMAAGAANETVSLAAGTLAVGIGLGFCLPSLLVGPRDVPAPTVPEKEQAPGARRE
jgi:hypothetical protein